MIGIAGAVTFGAVMGVVEMDRDFVAAEASVHRAIDRQIVVDPGQDRLTVARLDQARRSVTGPPPVPRT